MKILIIGGVVGGVSAATRLRRNLEEAEIVLIERGSMASLANCALPHYTCNLLRGNDDPLVTAAEQLQKRFRLDLRPFTSAKSIDRDGKTVTLRDLKTQALYEESYDYLILATGALPVRRPLPGIGLAGVFSIGSTKDALRVCKQFGQIKKIVIANAGFTGLETAQELSRRGTAVELVESGPQLLSPFDSEMTSPLEEILKANRVNVHLNESLVAIEPGLKTHLHSDKKLKADLVLLGLDIRPENALAVDAGLTAGPRGGILVNEHMRTVDPHIFAVGDWIHSIQAVEQHPVHMPLPDPSYRQGKIAADCIAGKGSSYRGCQGTVVVELFNLYAGATGASEGTLRSHAVPLQKVYIHANQNRGYPIENSLTLKVLFQPSDGKILGAQAIGGAGVEKQIDAMAVAIQGGLTVYDLENTELSCTSSRSPAKDPINLAGSVAANLLRGDHPQISAEEITAELSVLDVRTEPEFAAGHIPGAQHIPLDELRARLDEIPFDKGIVVYSQAGTRGYVATRILMQKGFEVRNLSGGHRSFLMIS
jgi:NADPH-dependent 2,4-dienoyl-CoA reductase/sulfur reductase-like enzyme/rhodanese-related sulfurtransferase